MVGGSQKIDKNEFYLCCKRGDPRIYENSIFPAYVPEKNKIITPWFHLIKIQKTHNKVPKHTIKFQNTQ